MRNGYRGGNGCFICQFLNLFPVRKICWEYGEPLCKRFPEEKAWKIYQVHYSKSTSQIVTLALCFSFEISPHASIFLICTEMCVYFSLGCIFWLKSLFIFLHSGLYGPYMLRPWCVCARRVPLLCGLGRLWVWESTGILYGPVLGSRSFPGRDGHL